MYILPNEAMELLQITTRQGLHKVVTNHNVTVKSQGAGKPNLYLKEDLERYKKDNKNIVKKTKTVIRKAEKIKKEKVQRINKNKALKKEVKKDLKINQEKSNDNWTVYTGKDNINKSIEDLTKKQKNKKEKVQSISVGPTQVGPDKEDEFLEDSKIEFKKPSDKDLENPLNEIGKNEFERVKDILIENGTYKDQDRALILAYSISYQKYIYAVAASAKEDDTTMDQFGNLKLHPYFTVADKCLTQMNKIASMLGIGAKNRIGLEIAKPKKQTFADVINVKEEWK